MTDQQAVLLFKCLADKSRLQILKSLMQEDMYVELLAQRLDLTPPTVSFHLKKLSEAGLVSARKSQYYTIYSLSKAALDVSLIDLLRPDPNEKSIQDQREIDYRNRVLATFLVNGKLVQIPAQRKKRLIVLEEMLKAFEKGRTYTEREVNIIIADFNDDFCTLRREMIDQGLMAREKGVYWVV